MGKCEGGFQPLAFPDEALQSSREALHNPELSLLAGNGNLLGAFSLTVPSAPGRFHSRLQWCTCGSSSKYTSH